MSKRYVYQLYVLYRLFYDLIEKFFETQNDSMSVSFNKWYFLLSNKIERTLKKMPIYANELRWSWHPFDALSEFDWEDSQSAWTRYKRHTCRQFLNKLTTRYAALGAKEYRWSKSDQKFLRDCSTFVHGDPLNNLLSLVATGWLRQHVGPAITSEPVPAGDAKRIPDADSTGENRDAGTKKAHVEAFSIPLGARWADVRIRLKDGESVSIRVGDRTGVYNYTQMGMCNPKTSRPTVQWQLLRTFAENHGLLTWKSPGADRKNPKRRERLSGDLRRFFGIKDDPFMLTHDKKGWQARFDISDD